MSHGTGFKVSLVTYHVLCVSLIPACYLRCETSVAAAPCTPAYCPSRLHDGAELLSLWSHKPLNKLFLLQVAFVMFSYWGNEEKKAGDSIRVGVRKGWKGLTLRSIREQELPLQTARSLGLNLSLAVHLTSLRVAFLLSNGSANIFFIRLSKVFHEKN